MKKPVKKPDQATITRAWVKTSKCYCRALKDHYPELLKDFDDKKMSQYGCDREMRILLNEADLASRNADIHRLYMKYVLQLSTKDLEQIITYDREGFIRRAPHTIDEINLELFHRVVESPESKGET
jgi:hypothetical protein